MASKADHTQTLSKGYHQVRNDLLSQSHLQNLHGNLSVKLNLLQSQRVVPIQRKVSFPLRTYTQARAQTESIHFPLSGNYLATAKVPDEKYNAKFNTPQTKKGRIGESGYQATGPRGSIVYLHGLLSTASDGKCYQW